MIDELKRQLAELDRDLKPVLAHVAIAQARRAEIAKSIAAQEAVASSKPKKAEPTKAPLKPDSQKKG